MSEMDDLVNVCKHINFINDLVLEDEERWNKRFMRESEEFWGEAIPSKIKLHQYTRWYEIMRSN